MYHNDPKCPICRGSDTDIELQRVQVWEDDLWRLTISLNAEVLAFAYLEPKRHITDITALDGEEARTFGEVLARVSEALRNETDADLVYVYVFGGGIPHLHVHLAPHHAGDALNTQMIRGEVEERKLDSGATQFMSKDFPALPESAQLAIARRISHRMG